MGRNLVIACMARFSGGNSGRNSDRNAGRSCGFRRHRRSPRAQKSLPGLKLQLQEGRALLSTLDAAQLQAARGHASSKEGRTGKSVERDASRAFGRNTLSAAATCVGLLAEYGPALLPSGTAMPADRVQHYMLHFAPMVPARRSARAWTASTDRPARWLETWQYRACGQTESSAWPRSGRAGR
jgi:hypothetical protein